MGPPRPPGAPNPLLGLGCFLGARLKLVLSMLGTSAVPGLWLGPGTLFPEVLRDRIAWADDKVADMGVLLHARGCVICLDLGLFVYPRP